MRLLLMGVIVLAWAQGSVAARPGLRFVAAGVFADEAGERRAYRVVAPTGGVAGILTVTCRDGAVVAASYQPPDRGGLAAHGEDIVRAAGHRLCAKRG